MSAAKGIAAEAARPCYRTNYSVSKRDVAIVIEFQDRFGAAFLPAIRTQVPKAVRLPQYTHWVGYEEWLEMNTLRLMTDLWMGPFPWMPDAQ